VILAFEMMPSTALASLTVPVKFVPNPVVPDVMLPDVFDSV
jgi:hypothetical protein